MNGPSIFGFNQITSQCDTQIWLNHYKGDFAAQARTTSLMMSLLMTGGFFCTPLIGAVSHCVGVFVGTGHGPWGILNGPATGLALAELAAGQKCTQDVTAFDPARFRSD